MSISCLQSERVIINNDFFQTRKKSNLLKPIKPENSSGGFLLKVAEKIG